MGGHEAEYQALPPGSVWSEGVGLCLFKRLWGTVFPSPQWRGWMAAPAPRDGGMERGKRLAQIKSEMTVWGRDATCLL